MAGSGTAPRRARSTGRRACMVAARAGPPACRLRTARPDSFRAAAGCATRFLQATGPLPMQGVPLSPPEASADGGDAHGRRPAEAPAIASPLKEAVLRAAARCCRAYLLHAPGQFGKSRLWEEVVRPYLAWRPLEVG